MSNKYTFRIFNSLLCLALVSLTFMAANCNDILSALTTSDDIVGTWTLTEQTGAQYDVCAQEQVNFSTSTATLTCPGSTSISRAYTASGGLLEYTATGIRYNYGVSTSSGSTILTLTGNNISRNLKYTKVITDNQSAGPQQKSDKQNFQNSSELK